MYRGDTKENLKKFIDHRMTVADCVKPRDHFIVKAEILRRPHKGLPSVRGLEELGTYIHGAYRTGVAA